ncbi:MAG TPA: tetratricopeptide repeat protein [Melioribacteraceae bacterium]|nr:tetratricopeptide repeat protein [Melioribacteraceae bacterium]
MKKLILIMVYLFPFFMFAQSVDLKDDTKKLYNEGLELRKQGNFKGSVDKFDEALKLENSYLIHFQKGVSQLKEKNTEAALVSFETALKSQPKFDQALFYAGQACFTLKQFEKAQDYFVKAKENTKNLQVKKAAESNIDAVLLQAGQTALANKNYNEAIKNFQEVIKSQPNNESALLGLADSYGEAGKYNESVEYAGKALTVRKNLPEGAIYYTLGSTYKKMGKNDLALQNFNKCINDKSAKNKGYRDRAEIEMKGLK